MKRAFLISVLLHFAILLTLMARQVPWSLQSPGGARPLTAKLQGPGNPAIPASGSAHPGRPGGAGARMTSDAGGAKTIPARSPSDSDFGQNFRSTAGSTSPVRSPQSSGALGGDEERPAYSPETGAEYRLSLVRHMRQERARERLAEASADGVVVVGLGSPLKGSPLQATLERSSGHPQLDRLAVEMVARAAQSVPPPPGLPGAGFRLSITIEYRQAD